MITRDYHKHSEDSRRQISLDLIPAHLLQIRDDTSEIETMGGIKSLEGLVVPCPNQTKPSHRNQIGISLSLKNGLFSINASDQISAKLNSR